MKLEIETAEDFTDVNDFACGVDELDANKHLWKNYSDHHLAVFYFVTEFYSLDDICMSSCLPSRNLSSCPA